MAKKRVKKEVIVKGYKCIDNSTYQYTNKFASLSDYFASLKENLAGKRISVKQDDTLLIVSDKETNEIALIKKDGKLLYSNGDFTDGKTVKAIKTDVFCKQLEG